MGRICSRGDEKYISNFRQKNRREEITCRDLGKNEEILFNVCYRKRV
jgi:hypothetical protein